MRSSSTGGCSIRPSAPERALCADANLAAILVRKETDMSADIPARERLIVALDVDTRAEALALIRTLGDDVVFYKVGLQLFMAHGFPIVRAVAELGKKVFLDLKINDTPRTVQSAVRLAADADVKLFTLQGNNATSAAARSGRGAQEFPKFLQVT